MLLFLACASRKGVIARLRRLAYASDEFFRTLCLLSFVLILGFCSENATKGLEDLEEGPLRELCFRVRNRGCDYRFEIGGEEDPKDYVQTIRCSPVAAMVYFILMLASCIGYAHTMQYYNRTICGYFHSIILEEARSGE